MGKTIRIGYVPEHFSTPLLLAHEKGLFNGLVELVCCPGGTGEMTLKLEERSLDLAIALTEGLVAGISKGQDWYKIVGTYVESPLCWAVSAGQNSKHVAIQTLRNSTVAISRHGSGSEIMAYVLADQQHWLDGNPPFQFKTLHNFKAMRDAVNEGAADFFMWETFTTKPYHDSGEVKRIGDITPPWPAFLFAAHTDLLKEDTSALNQVLGIIQTSTTEFLQDKATATRDIIRFLGYNEEDVHSWLKTVRYPADHLQVSKKALQVAIEALAKAGAVGSIDVDPAFCCDLSVARLV